MAKYEFHSSQVIGTYSAETIQDARDEFIQWSFKRLLDLQQIHPLPKIVRSSNGVGTDTIVFTVDGVECERWQLRKSSWLMDKIRKWIG